MNPTSKLSCIVIDDDPLMTDLILHFCEKITDIEYCVACNSSIDGLQLLSENDYDLVFLDYNMPEVNGKAILRLKQDSSKVVMITSNTEFAVDSYDYDAVVDYLVKPINFERFQVAISKVKNALSSASSSPAAEDNDRLFVKDGKKWIPVKYEDIMYIQSDSNYVMIHKEEQSIMSLLKLADLEKTLPKQFVRVHRSYIINLDYVDYFTSEEISVKQQAIPISQAYKSKVKAIFS